jgi:anti-anti-sigma regulatory factor
LNAEHAGALRQILQGAFDAFSRVSMDMAQVTEMDDLCLRQLCSAHHRATLLEKNFTILGVRPSVAERAVDPKVSGVCNDCAVGVQNCPWRTSFEYTAL